MTDTNSNFDFSFDPNLDIFGDSPYADEPTTMDEVEGADPGLFLPNTEGRSEFLPPDPERVPKVEYAVRQDSPEYKLRPASERTRELMAYMRPHRQVLFGLLRAAHEPISTERMAEVAAELRAHKFSVYSPANLCTMLETAGAIDRCAEDGGSMEDYEPEPEIVVIDGVEYYEPLPRPVVYWKTTQAGQDALDANDPMDRLERLFGNESKYLLIYKRVLRMTSRADGATMKDLSLACNEEECIAKPRVFFVQHFAENLERCEAVEWDGKVWRTTGFGTRALDELLNEVEDAFEVDGVYAEGHVPTESDGINW